MALFRDMNSVWNDWVDPQNPPCRACVRADLARPEVLVEIMVTAAKWRFRYPLPRRGRGCPAQEPVSNAGGTTALSAARDPQGGGSLEQSYGRPPRSRRQVGNTGEQLS